MSEAIDWEQQWAIHSPGFKNGHTTVPLSKNQTIKLFPGPGFGDYSHPTTQLMLSEILKKTKNQIIFDIGCGSGILSIAASKLGAKKVYACDISQDAIMHTQFNANENDTPIFFSKPHEKPIVLMNMIFSEQKEAWETYRLPFQFLITSGILISEKDSYFEYAQNQNWQLISETESSGWLCCTFKELV